MIPSEYQNNDTSTASDGEAPVLGLWEYPFIAITLRSTLTWIGSTYESNRVVRIIIIISYLKSYNCVQIICIRKEYLINRNSNVE